jgi:hypothetical protein
VGALVVVLAQVVGQSRSPISSSRQCLRTRLLDGTLDAFEEKAQQGTHGKLALAIVEPD